MTAVIFHALAWPTLGVAILVFGFAPGFVLRLLVLCYPRSNPRRRELLGELYAVPRIERPFWVAEQVEVALFEGLRDRFKGRSIAEKTPAKPGRVRKVRGVLASSVIALGGGMLCTSITLSIYWARASHLWARSSELPNTDFWLLVSLELPLNALLMFLLVRRKVRARPRGPGRHRATRAASLGELRLRGR
jgi:hypothetical protein